VDREDETSDSAPWVALQRRSHGGDYVTKAYVPAAGGTSSEM
jgi:hypothetical protein